MSQYNEGCKAFIANETIARFNTVKLVTSTGDRVAVAGSNEANIGFADDAVTSGEYVTVRLKSTGKTFKALAAGAFAVGAALYNHAAGTVDDGSGGTQRYVALEAAAAAGDVVEVLPIAAY
jgi:hypothetical protein